MAAAQRQARSPHRRRGSAPALSAHGTPYCSSLTGNAPCSLLRAWVCPLQGEHDTWLEQNNYGLGMALAVALLDNAGAAQKTQGKLSKERASPSMARAVDAPRHSARTAAAASRAASTACGTCAATGGSRVKGRIPLVHVPCDTCTDVHCGEHQAQAYS